MKTKLIALEALKQIREHGLSWDDAYDYVISALEADLAQPVMAGESSERLVTITSSGVSFGNNLWVSHEHITGYSADQLNSGNCRITGKAYMNWINAVPQEPAAPGAAS